MTDHEFKPPLKDHPKDGHCFNVSGAALSDGSFFGYSHMDKLELKKGDNLSISFKTGLFFTLIEIKSEGRTNQILLTIDEAKKVGEFLKSFAL